MSTADVKVVRLHTERERLSRTARDSVGESGDSDADGTDLETHRTSSEGESETPPPIEAETPAEAAEQRRPARTHRVVRRARTPSPAAVLARTLERTQSAKTEGVIQALEQETQRPVRGARQAEAPVLPSQPSALTDEEEFWSTWLEHRDYLHRHSIRFSGGNLAEAEDALSEAMLKAARTFSAAKIRNRRAWLLRLVHNACMDRHRSNRRHRRAIQDIKDADSRSAPAVAVQPDRTPEDLLAAFQQFESLQRALGALPAFLVEPLMLHLDDRPDAEIAGTLKVTREVVRKRRQIARALLRRHLST